MCQSSKTNPRTCFNEATAESLEAVGLNLSSGSAAGPDRQQEAVARALVEANVTSCPGLREVVAAFGSDIPWRVRLNFLVTPQPDFGGFCPLVWLGRGHFPDPVVAAASVLGESP